MTDDRPQHSGGFSGSLSAVRAAVVLVAFIAAVAVLVAVGTRPTVTSPASSAQTTVPPASSSTTTTSAPGGSTTSSSAAGGASHTTTTAASSHHHGGKTTTTTTQPHSAVAVTVANATNTNGLAEHYTTVIGAGGWAMQTPIDASTTEATSAVYYAPGKQEAAASIATAIGVKPAQVLPFTSSVPVSGVTGTQVVVLIGEDLASGAAAS